MAAKGDAAAGGGCLSGSKSTTEKRNAASKVTAKSWCVYVLRCSDGSLYCGITNDLPKRLLLHDRGAGARYTRGRGPVKLLHTWPAADKSAALKAEIAFKKLTRRAKLAFIKPSANKRTPASLSPRSKTPRRTRKEGR